MSHSDWHLNRNKHNKLPTGKLIFIEKISFKDADGVIWKLQPHSGSMYHQTGNAIAKIETPYPNINVGINYNESSPNLKFLSKDEQSGSFEAILQPNGEYLIAGPLQGTYNYSHPRSYFGYKKHVLLDVVPHFISSNYKE